MEFNENITPVHPSAQPQLILTENAIYYLKKAGDWAYFLGIVGFIATAFIALAALFVGTIMTTMATINPMMGAVAGMGGLITGIYLLIAVVSFFFALYLYQFGNRIKSAAATYNTDELTNALGKLKSFFKLWGIITIVYISLMILIFAGSIIAGIGAASAMRG